MRSVKPKKSLGQHFLKDKNIAVKIVDSLTYNGYKNLLEIGPGMGILTKELVKKDINIKVVEIDEESVNFLTNNITSLRGNIVNKDFLKINLSDIFNLEPYAIIGNFPYNISSQIVFRVLENKDLIPEFCGMFQKEVAERICEDYGSKKYGILSVYCKAFYSTEYLFDVSSNVFFPEPKVTSAVVRFTRKENYKLDCDEISFLNIVKTAFNHRRKTLRNSLKVFNLSDNLREDSIFDLRPEQLSVENFINLTIMIDSEIKNYKS